MARPVKFRGKWRIRWFDEFGKRQSDVFDDYKHAAAELRRHQHEVEEVRRGLRSRYVRATSASSAARNSPRRGGAASKAPMI
jgi:hypothetical protein